MKIEETGAFSQHCGFHQLTKVLADAARWEKGCNGGGGRVRI